MLRLSLLLSGHNYNMKVLLRERKRHTERGASSTPSVVLYRGYPCRGGTPPQVPSPPSNLAGGVPYPWSGVSHLRYPHQTPPPRQGYSPWLDLTGVPPPHLDMAGVPLLSVKQSENITSSLVLRTRSVIIAETTYRKTSSNSKGGLTK